MSFFSKLHLPFGGSGEHLKVLEQGISVLRLSTFYSLQKKFVPKYGLETASTLAVAVVSVMILESPNDANFTAFYETHRKEIGQEALAAHNHSEISGPSGCASYLYAAEILHSTMVKAAYLTDATKNWKSTKALQEQAANLNIVVPSSRDICDSDDRVKCIEAIHSFAKAFYYTNTWIGASPAVTEVSFPSIPYSYEFLTKMLLNMDSAAPENAVPPEKVDDNQEISSLFRLRMNN